MTDHRVLSEAYRPGVPLRQWNLEPEDDTAVAAELTLKGSGAIDAVRRLIAGDRLEQDDVVALGRLNFHCFLQGWEPMVALFDDVPRIDPAIGPLLERHSKHFR
jgi:hypothetical protein